MHSPIIGYISPLGFRRCEGEALYAEEEKCVSDPAAVAGIADRGDEWGEFGNNDDFCTREKRSWIKALWQIHDDICIPGRKCRSWKIKDLAENMTTNVYFCILFMFGAELFCLKSTG